MFGSFSLEIEDRDGPIKLIARNELGLNPVFDAWSTGLGIIDPTREQNFVISPLSTLVYLDDRFSYESVKEKLGVDSNFMVRFDDPYLSINNAASNKAALVNTQLLMMFEVLAWLQDYSGGAPGNERAKTKVMDAIKKGRAEGLNKVSNALFEKASQGNVTAMIYYLKVRDRENWGENQPEPLREIPPMQIVVAPRAMAG